MNKLDKKKSDRYLDAKKQVDELKGFYIHLMVYLTVNLFISGFLVFNALRDGDSFREALFNFPVYAVWLFWGIGIFFHAWGVFGRNVLFGKNWEEQKIKQYIEEDKKEFTNRYE